MFESWTGRRPAWSVIIIGTVLALCAVCVAIGGFGRLTASEEAPVLSQAEVDRTLTIHLRRIKRVLGSTYTREPTVGPMMCPGRVVSLDRRAGRSASFSVAIAKEDRPAVATRLRDELRQDGWTADYPVEDGPRGRVEMLEARSPDGYRVSIDVARYDDMAVQIHSPCYQPAGGP